MWTFLLNLSNILGLIKLVINFFLKTLGIAKFVEKAFLFFKKTFLYITPLLIKLSKEVWFYTQKNYKWLALSLILIISLLFNFQLISKLINNPNNAYMPGIITNILDHIPGLQQQKTYTQYEIKSNPIVISTIKSPLNGIISNIDPNIFDPNIIFSTKQKIIQYDTSVLDKAITGLNSQLPEIEGQTVTTRKERYNTPNQLEIVNLQNQIDELTLQISQQDPLIQIAQTKVDSWSGLYDEGIISRVEFESAQKELLNLQNNKNLMIKRLSGLERSLAQLKQLEKESEIEIVTQNTKNPAQLKKQLTNINNQIQNLIFSLKKYQIFCPFECRVNKVYIKEGDKVKEGDKLIDIFDSNSFNSYIILSDSDLDKIKKTSYNLYILDESGNKIHLNIFKIIKNKIFFNNNDNIRKKLIIEFM